MFNLNKLKKWGAIALIIVLLSLFFSTNKLSDSRALARQPELARVESECSRVEKLAPLMVDGKWIEDEAGNQVTLRGISFCGFDNAWGERVLPDFRNKVAKVTNGNNGWYPNLLRLPIKQRHLDNFNLEQIYLVLKGGVDECVAQKVYCIIDWHPVDGELGADWQTPKMDKKTRDFWNYIAPRFRDYSNVLFEVYNEPGFPKEVTAENWLNWRNKAQEWVDLIRSHAPDNIILIGSPLWSQIIQFAPEYPFAGNNLAYVNHTYPGMEQSWPRDVGIEYDWERVFGKAADRVPIFITEFGWQGNSEWDFGQGTTAEFGQPMKDFLSNRPNINWTIWTYDSYCAPRLADDRDRVLEGKDEMGGFVRDWLQQEWRKPTNPVGSTCDRR